MHEEDAMQKGMLFPWSFLFIDFVLVVVVATGPCCELLTCLIIDIAVSGFCSRHTVFERIECRERVYIVGSWSRELALIYSAQVRTLPDSRQRVGT